MKLDKHVVDMFTELTKPADDVKMEKTCYGTISVVDGTRYVKLDGSDLLVPAASTVKTSHGDRVTVLMKNHSLTVTGNLTAPATDGEGGSSGEAGTAATIEVGTVTTGEAGSSASVTNSGTTSAAVFDFVIPRGDKGEKGDTGPQGPQGEKGDTGTWDGTIPDHEHTVSDITDFPTSLPANGGNAQALTDYNSTDVRIMLGWRGASLDSTTHLAGYDLSELESNGIVKIKDINVDRAYVGNAGNADTVDGKHAESFMQWLGILNDTDFMNDANHKVDYHCNISDGTLIGLPMANWYHIVYYMHSYSNGHGMQIAYPLSFDGATFIRRSDGTTWTNWKNVADGGNADTVDGKHASDFASYQPYAPIFTGNILDITEMGTYSCHISNCSNLPSGIYDWGYVTMYNFINSGYKRFICTPLDALGDNYSGKPNGMIYLASESYKDADGNLIWSRACDGGNADTVGNLPASSFLGSNTNFNYHYANGAGTQVVSMFRWETHIFAFNYTDTPTAYGFLDVSSFNGEGFAPAPFGLVRQVWTDWSNPSEVFVRIYKATSETDGTWTDWSRRNAASVGTYTEAKLAELEARIAALERGAT